MGSPNILVLCEVGGHLVGMCIGESLQRDNFRAEQVLIPPSNWFLDGGN